MCPLPLPIRLSRHLAIAIVALLGSALWFLWPDAHRSGMPFPAEAIALPAATAQETPAPSTANVPQTEAATLTGEAAREELRKNGQYESLGAALQAARYAVEKIDPAGPHSRGAEYFASNPQQQLRAWFSKDGVELASGRRSADGDAEPWSLARTALPERNYTITSMPNHYETYES